MHLSSRSVFQVSLVVAWLFGIGSFAEAQINPAVDALLKQSTKVYSGMKSYRHTAVFAIKIAGVKPNERKYTLAVERPDKFRFEQIGDDSGQAIIAVSNGKTFLNFKSYGPWNEPLQEYTRSSTPVQYKDLNLSDVTDVPMPPSIGSYLIAWMLQGKPFGNEEMKKAMEQATLRSNVPEDGKKWQVLTIPLNSSGYIYFGYAYFDPKTHLLGKAVVKYPDQSTNNLAEELVETIKDIQIDKPIPDSVFAYTPPATAKLVEKFTDPAALAALLAQKSRSPLGSFSSPAPLFQGPSRQH